MVSLAVSTARSIRPAGREVLTRTSWPSNHASTNPCTIVGTVRPDRSRPAQRVGSCCHGLAGESPAAVSAGAPRSRLRAPGEILSSEWSVKSLQGVVRHLRREQTDGPSMKRTLQPREISSRKRGLAEPLVSRRRQQTASGTGSTQDALGVWRTARRDSQWRNRRDPHRWPTSGRSDRYKPMVKCDQTGRESEGFIVLMTPGDKPGRGKGPCFGYAGVRR